jgi:hypothetical protein
MLSLRGGHARSAQNPEIMTNRFSGTRE